jgi:putative addiction module antidote
MASPAKQIAVQATAVKVIAIGNSQGVILPKETLARFNLQKGDTLYVTEGPLGIHLVPYDEEFAAQMEAAREVMRENRDVLRKLAE